MQAASAAREVFMTQLLIRLFIRHPDNPQDPHTRAAYGNLASIVGMVCNVLLCRASSPWARCSVPSPSWPMP